MMTKRPVRRILILLLCALAALGLFMAAAMADGGITTWAQLQTAINNAGSGDTITLTRNLTAGSNDVALQIHGTVTLDLNGFTLNRNQSSANMFGSAIYVPAGASLTVRDSSGNRTGAITGGYAEMGGGIWNEGTLTITGGTITGNYAYNNNGGGAGGGIYNTGTLTMSGGTISGNTADLGGGLLNDGDGTASLSDAAITGNTTTVFNGGALMNYGTAVLTRCSLSDNTSKGNGGGIWSDGSVTLADCVISGNSADYDGGGIYIRPDAAVTCSGSTSITGNSAKNSGGGIFNNGTLKAKGTLTVQNNKVGEDDNNLYLKDGKVITLTGALAADSVIGISGENLPGRITSGWSTWQGTAEPTVFAHDDGHSACVLENGEAVIRIYYVRRDTEGPSVIEYVPAGAMILNGERQLSTTDPSGVLWVVVNRTQTISERMSASDDINLVLVNGVTLTAAQGIRVAEGHTLTIYGQFGDEGKFVATAPDDMAGIGSNSRSQDFRSGTIVIHGGTIEATGGEYGAGIGGGDEAGCGTVTIYGGSVTATGGDYGAGIGTGDEYTDEGQGTVSIHGGTVTAQGGQDAAGIGGGNEAGCGTVTIYGGIVTATGGQYGAGIGTGDEYDGDEHGTVSIRGGTVTAQGGEDAAGIGGGNEDDGPEVRISGGQVTATGGQYGPGIGGGDDVPAYSVLISGGTVTAKGGWKAPGIGCGEGSEAIGTIRIAEGEVTATGGDCSAGIGGGFDTSITSGTIQITSGTVVATGLDSAGIGGGRASNVNASITISGGHVIASCQNDFFSYAGAGIGAGPFYMTGGDFTGTITISGGTVEAYGGAAGNSSNKPYGGAGLGAGYAGTMSGTINITGGTVTAVGTEGASAVGGGYHGYFTGTINITGGTVSLKSMKIDEYDGYLIGAVSNVGTPFSGTLNLGSGRKVEVDGVGVPTADRASTCESIIGDATLIISECDHADVTYMITEDTHTACCVFCEHQADEEPHIFDPTANHQCTVCGYNSHVVYVFFDSNGGSGVEAQPVPNGGKAARPGDPTRAGHAFLNWYRVTNADTGEHETDPFDFEHTDITASITLIAEWQTVQFGTPDFVIPSDAAVIEDNAFENIAATVVEIPAGCTYIGDEAFKNCAHLTMIRIPAGCVLGTDVFDGCTQVYVFGAAGSDAQRYCTENANCVFVEDARD